MRTQLRLAAVLGAALVAAPLAFAAPKPFTETFTRSFPLEPTGTLRIENPNGKITVTATNRPQLVVRADVQIQGVDDEAIREGRAKTQLSFGGDARNRLVRTTSVYPVPRNRWVPVVNLSIEVPEKASVTVVAYNADPVDIVGVAGAVRVKTVNGLVRVRSIGGPLVVDTVNANVFARLTGQPRSNVLLASVNGLVELRVAAEAQFAWVAETLKGQIYTTLQNRGSFLKSTAKVYRSLVNDGYAPVIQMKSVTAPLFLLRPDDGRQNLVALEPPQVGRPSPGEAKPRTATAAFDIQRVRRFLIAEPSSRAFAIRQELIDGDFGYAINVGNIAIGEVSGNTRLSTQGGEIVVGRIGGQGDLKTRGGPINVGDVMGPLRAVTGAGDVHVRAAHRGGTLLTDGGNIEVLFSGGPLDVRSGGGNIAVRRVAGDVVAETKSGDVTLFTEAGSSDRPIEARTSDGSIWLNVDSRRKADVDITVITTPDASRAIISELPGLTITREPFQGRMKVRAVGKLNGGGERITLHSENGSVQLTSRPHAEVLARRK